MTDALGWTVVHEPGTTIRLVDGQGVLRATVVGQDGNGDPGPAVRVGRIPDGWTGVLTCEDGRTSAVANGRTGGLRRRFRTAVVELGACTWTYRHTTDRRAEITRDGHAVARVHRRYRWWRPGARAGATARIDYTFTARDPALGPDDELMITLFAVVLGPPGREGAAGQIGHGLWDLASIFS